MTEKILVCFISNDSENLEISLAAHSANFTPETKALILDTAAAHEKNKTIAGEFNAIHASEEEFKTRAKDEFKPLFQGKYGGNRNICLYHAFKEKAHAVFFDDDTTPFENPLEKYEMLFGEGKKIVAGKYLRHATGTPQIIKETIDTIEACAVKEMQDDEARDKLSELFSAIPKEIQTPPRGMGVVGGNVGIHFDCLSKYCFFPTDYRVEDGTYGVLAKTCAGEEPFNREDNPAVFHNKKPRENALLSNLENELRGNVVALCVKDSLEENELSMDTVEDKIKRNSALVFKAFNFDYLQFKNDQRNLAAKAKELGFEKQFAQLLSTRESTFKPSEQEVKAKSALFQYAQDNWPKALNG